MIKNLCLLLVLLLVLRPAQATTYFMASSAQARTDFPTLALVPGDSVLFQRGQVFQGPFTIKWSGTSTNPIVIGAYGTGAKPVITGLTTLNTWTSLTGGVWEASSASFRPTLSMVLVNGAVTAMGRYPNASATNGGYLTYQSHTGSNSITSSGLTGAPDFTGAELVLRLQRFYTDRCKVTSQVGTTVTFATQSGSAPTDGFGFFFQNSPATLDQPGEWWYDSVNKKVRMYLGGSSAGYAVKASTVDTLLTATGRSYVVVDNLSLEGANDIGLAVSGGSNFTVKNCDVRFSGRDAITLAGTVNFTSTGNYIDYSNSRGINGFQSNAGPTTVTNNTVRNTGVFPGMGWKKAKDGVLVAIEVTYPGSLVQGNTVTNTGYIGIRFYGDNTVVRNNVVDTFCFNKDDGAGIYTWNGNGVTHTGTQVLSNVVKNGIGALAGCNSTNPEAQGFYYDDQSNNIYTANNQVFNCRKGIYLHSAANCLSEFNTFTNCAYGYYTQWETGDQEMTNDVFTNNTIVSTSSSQYSVYVNYINAPGTTPVTGMGLIDSNTYYRPAGEATSVVMYKVHAPTSTDYTFAAWRTTFSMDLHSLRLTSGRAYYFSASAGSDAYTSLQAASTTTPWQTLSKLNGLSLQPGDSVLLRRGDTWQGSITISSSGTATQPIVLGAYGTGSRPRVSGLETVSAWTALGNGVWESNTLSTGTTVNIVLVGGVQYAMGRYPNWDYPNGGYFTYEHHTANTITDDNQSFDAGWVGAEAVLRTDHAALGRTPVSAVSGGQLTIDGSALSAYGYGLPSSDGWGYFLQNSPKTLDQFGEWYYNPTTHKLQVYFGTLGPTRYSVQASAVDVLLEPQGSNLTVRDLALTGANEYGVWNDWSGKSNLKFVRCTVRHSGIDGLLLGSKTNLTVDSCVFTYANSNALSVGYNSMNVQITNTTMDHSGTMPGMVRLDEVNRYGYGTYSSGYAAGTQGLTFTGNTVLHTGYIGLFFAGDNNLVQNNQVDSVCLVLDDGAGIYTSNYTCSTCTPAVNVNNRILSNVVTHAVGQPYGTPGLNNMAHSYYMDDNTNHVTFTGNVGAYAGYSGLFIHNTNNYTVRDNLFYDNAAAQVYWQDDNLGGFITNGVVKHNQLFAPSGLFLPQYGVMVDDNTLTGDIATLLQVPVSRVPWAYPSKASQLKTFTTSYPDLLVHVTANSVPIDGTRAYLDSVTELPAYLSRVAALAASDTIAKKDSVVWTQDNEEFNKGYRVTDSVTTAALYCATLSRVTDTLHHYGIKVANGGFTGPVMRWLVWYDLKYAQTKLTEADEYAYSVFTAAERSNLANWPTLTNYAREIAIARKLLSRYRTMRFDCFNLHWEFPTNGVDTGHLNKNALRWAVRYYKQATGKPVIFNEIGNKSSNATLLSEALEVLQELQVPLGIMYSGTATVTNASGGGQNIAMNTGSALNTFGNAIKTKLSGMTSNSLQQLLYLASADNNLSNFAVIDSNYYSSRQPVMAYTNVFSGGGEHFYDFSGWKTALSKDAATTKVALTSAYRLQANPSSTPVVTRFCGKTYTSLTGTAYAESFTTAPWTSAVLLR
jgi:parallel beta-helix repeat protein